MTFTRTFAYIAYGGDGEIGVFQLLPNGELRTLPRVAAGKGVMSLAINHDQRLLYASVRSPPFSVHSYAIDAADGALHRLAVSPLPDSMTYLSLDRSGRFLFGASYGGNLVSVHAIGADGRPAHEPLQVLAAGRNPHSIRIDATNRYVFVPALGSGEILQYLFDAERGRLAPNAPASLPAGDGHGPRHCIFSGDNRFLYVLNEFSAEVTTFALDDSSGQLRRVSSASALPPGSALHTGAARAPAGGVNSAHAQTRDRSEDIWAADIHTTADGGLLYVSERTGSTLSAMAVDRRSGALTFLGSTASEQQPRGFNIDPSGRYLLATGELSNTLSVHAIEPDTGALRLLARYPAGAAANWVKFVNLA